MYNYSIVSIVRYCFLSYHYSKYMETKSARQIRSTCIRARKFHPPGGGGGGGGGGRARGGGGGEGGRGRGGAGGGGGGGGGGK